MNRVPYFLILLAVMSFAAFNATGQAPAEKRNHVLSVLKEGQPASLKEVQGRYEISTIDGIPGPLGYKVIEIGADHLVIQDITGINELHIPVFSIKAIIRVKVPEK